MHFINGRIIEVQPGKPVDIVIALHACDIATDEAIAKGIKIGGKTYSGSSLREKQIRVA